MKRTVSSAIQTNRNSLSENLALTFALPVGIITAIAWWGIFYQFHSAIAITGWPSIGAAVLINAGFIAFIGFLFGYLRGQKTKSTSLRSQLSKPKFIFDCLTLAVAYTIIAVVLSAAAIYILSEAFKNLTMPLTSAAFVIGVFGAATTYSIISTSVRLQSRDIVNALSLFIAGGVLISMVTAQNPYWWEINFSSLGTSVSISSFAFNITLILSGLLLLSLTDYLLSDLKSIVKGQSKTVEVRTQAVKILFILISLSFAGVGLFPWNRFPFLHTSSAYLLVIWFSVLIIGMRWFIPLISKQFLANSYSILFVLLGGFLLWQPFHYINQTAYELLAFSLTFIWLVLFLRTITLMREQVLAKQA